MIWSGRWDLNPRQPAWKAGTLPLSYARPSLCQARLRHISARDKTSCDTAFKKSSFIRHQHRFSPNHRQYLSRRQHCLDWLRARTSSVWWAGKGSNLGSHQAADLQSAPFVHLGTCPSDLHFRPQWNFNPAGKSEIQAASILIWQRMREVTPCTAPQQVIDGWLAEDDEDWPGIESIRFY